MGDGTALSVGEAVARLGVSDTTVRTYVAANLLRAWWTAGGHARIDPTSVDELLPLLRMAPGPDRDSAFEALRAANARRSSGA